MSENKNIINKHIKVFVAASISLYIVWTLTSLAFNKGIIFWNFNFSLDFWDITLNLLLLLIVLAGWIMVPGRLFYIGMREIDASLDMGDVLFKTIMYFMGMVVLFLIISLSVVSQSPTKLNTPVGEGVHMARFGQELYSGIWFSGTVGNEKGCGVTLGNGPIYPFTERGEIFVGESAIVEGYRITKEGEFYEEITERINVTLLEINCPGDSLLSRGIFEIKKVNP